MNPLDPLYHTPSLPLMTNSHLTLKKTIQGLRERSRAKGIGIASPNASHSTILHLKLKTNRLLLDFFKERTTNQNSDKRSSVDKELLQEAEDWINGREPRGLFLAWEVERNRQIYLKDMEKGGEWKALDQENQEVAFELESEVFAALLHELLLDISPLV
ncbi:UNVERIFIED_CONTAM: hypothetical protein Scaly_2402700 [Sesamum calycinum]|uniref:DUF4378 domain-containing protein n=1 Tax=Sesamum calycinum TaxID=2727403 RepID=A0AAW2M2N0_9LAMI